MSDKILCLADLHMRFNGSFEFNALKDIVKREKPTYVLIAGDVFENDISFNPYKELAKLKVPVICCFGNHEFAYKSIKEVYDFYEKYYNPEKYDVHYLDLIGHKEIEFNGEKVNIVGNVLWYDGSLKDFPGQADEIIPQWLDHTIKDFDFKAENMKCIEQIKSNFVKNEKNIMLTHCVPSRLLNMFSFEGLSKYNMYSGCELLKQFRNEGTYFFDWVICGHTHRYTTLEWHDQRCVNVGNDYFHNTGEIKYFIIEDI